MKNSEDPLILRAVIYAMANKAYQEQVVETDSESLMIGPGNEYESKKDWIESYTNDHIENVLKNTVNFKKKKIPPNPKELNASRKFYNLPLGESVKIGLTEEVRRVPTGWVYEKYYGGSVSLLFIPYGDDFLHLFEEGLYENPG